MKKTPFLFLFLSLAANAQWSKASDNGSVVRKSDNSVYYKLDMNAIRTKLSQAAKVGESKPVTIEIPNAEGDLERFAVNSFPVFDEEMSKQYQLGSYVGTDIDNPSKIIRFSVSPNDFQSMMSGDGKFEFIEPANDDKSLYSLHSKTSRKGKAFVCNTKESPESVSRLEKLMEEGSAAKANNRKYHTLKLAMAVTGEYTAFFGNTSNAVAQINATMTRVNAVFEQEFNLHLNVITAPNLIFTNASTDPFSPAAQFCKWNYELMNALHGGTFGVTDASFDIGHLFGATGGGGNAGCIGCIGSNDISTTSYTTASGGCGYAYISPNNYKGSGITAPADASPKGDTFDIDYVAHEMGHQLGDSHTYSFYETYLNKEMEPGSGSTIMGYAGITGANTDVQAHSDPYFHSASIDQVQAVLAATAVDVETNITNNTPVVTAMPTTYTIPRSTAFVLTAVATDPDNNPLTYCWEQVDYSTLANGVGKASGTGDGAAAIGANTSGGTFRSIAPTSNPKRYFPKLATVLGGAVKNVSDFEAASSVARTTNFRVTVRDNVTGGQAQTAYANQVIVVGSAAAFTVNAASGKAGTPLNVTWTVSGTTASPYNVVNVKIDYTIDGGANWTVLSASTANTGTASVTFPASLGASTPYVRVSAIGNVFYAVNKVTLTASLATSENTKDQVQIYPNPATDKLFVKNVSAKSTYSIFDATGRLVSEGSIVDGEINVSKLVKGTYVISFTNDGNSTKTKFIKK